MVGRLVGTGLDATGSSSLESPSILTLGATFAGSFVLASSYFHGSQSSSPITRSVGLFCVLAASVSFYTTGEEF